MEFKQITYLTGLYIFLIFPVYAEDSFVAIQPAVREVKMTGFTRARSSMPLSTEVDGKVETVFADIGEQIPDNGHFACLDDTFINIDIKLAANDVKQHGVDIRYYKKQVARYQALVANNSAAVNLLDDFKRKLGNSELALQRDALMKRRREETRRRHCILAPSGWHVIKRSIEPGQWIKVGDIVAEVSDFSRLLIPFALSKAELADLRNKQRSLHVFLTEYNLEIPAKIERISPAFDERSHKIRVDLVVKEGVPDFRGGVRTELKLELADEFGAFTIDKKAIHESFEETWVQRKDGKKIRVTLLSYLPDGSAKITSPELNVGDQFKILRN